MATTKKTKTNQLAQRKAEGLAIRLPSGLGESVTTLQEYGTLDAGGFQMRPDVTALQWATQVLPAAVIASEGSQFALADAILAGQRWADVGAIDLTTGDPADEESAYGDDPNIAPFSYSQVAEIIGRPAHTLQNLVSVARRFPLEIRREIPFARFSHYAAVAARDLPEDKVRGWLSRAGMGGSDGLTVAALEHERDEWRRARDAAARAKVDGLKASGGSPAPKPAAAPLRQPHATIAQGISGRAAPVAAPRDGMLLKDAQRACRGRLREIIAATGTDVDGLADAVIEWLYMSCPEQAILGALAFRMAAESGDSSF